MTMMTRLLTLLALVLSLAAGVRPALAQSGNSFAPVITVNGLGITEYDINQRLRFMQLLNAAGSTREDAEEALIQDRLRVWSSNQIGLKLDDAGLQKGMAEFAGRANLSTEKFLEALKQ